MQLAKTCSSIAVATWALRAPPPTSTYSAVSLSGFEDETIIAAMRQLDHVVGAETEIGWRRKAGQVSLAEVHRSIVVPVTASFWRKMLAFSGPGFLVAVGYMDPGNWATDLANRAKFG